MTTSRNDMKAKMAPPATPMEQRMQDTPRLEPTAGYLYVMNDVDRSKRSGKNVSFAVVTAAKDEGMVGRYLLYLTDRAVRYGDGYFIAWGDVLSLV